MGLVDGGFRRYEEDEESDRSIFTKVDPYKNTFLNLALPTVLLAEPMPPTQNKSRDDDPIVGGPVKCVPEGFSSWDKVVVDKGDVTLQDLVDHVEEEYNCSIQILSAGNACLYNAFSKKGKERLPKRVVELYEEITKNKLPNNRTYSFFQKLSAPKNQRIFHEQI